MVRRRILIVDDNVQAVDCLAVVLSCWGYDVRVAYDGPPGIEIALEFRPHIVLLDIELPTLDGFEVARELRALTGDDHLILVAVTGHDVHDMPELRRSSDFDEVLRKPLDFSALERFLKRSDACKRRPKVGPHA